MSHTASAQPADDQLGWRRSSLVAAGACVAIGLMEFAKDYVMAELQGTDRPMLFALRDEALWWVGWMALMPGVIWLVQRFRFDAGRWRLSVPVHVIVAVVLSVGHIAVFSATYFAAVGPSSIGQTVGATVAVFESRYLATDLLIYSAAVGAYYAFEYSTRFRRQALAAAQAESRAARLQLNLVEARIHALRMELNPHFLFNALNSVAGLVRKREHDAAIGMLAQLGDLLRTTLDREMPAEVPLRDELGFLGRFVDIELVRFGDRLRVTWDIEPDTRDALVPPLILQPLVENALRHGIGRRPGAAQLRVSARRIGERLELAVRDSGEGLVAVNGREPREGIGLSNTRARLAELYGASAASLEIADAPGGGVRACLVLPFHTTIEERDVAVGA